MPCNCVNCRRDDIINGVIQGKCDDCFSVITLPSDFKVFLEKIVCETCIKNEYQSCKCCSQLNKKSEFKIITEKFFNEELDDGGKYDSRDITVCKSCYSKNYKSCYNCSCISNKRTLISHNNNYFCQECFTKLFKRCHSCGTSFRSDDGNLREISHNTFVCMSCWSYTGPISRYESKPSLKFLGNPPHYYGIELEVELTNQKREERGGKAQEVMELFPKDFIITKEDGSLKCGFEIVTQPSSLEEQKKHWSKFFDKLPQNLVSFNGSNCGLHIHCAKKPLSLLTIGKIVVFVNDDKNKQFIETIAGRKSNQYSVIKKKNYGYVNKDKYDISREQRYEAVNLINKDTIEFRIFKGTLKPASFFKALEFCDSLTKFCMTANNSISYCQDIKNYIDYVGLRSKDYPHLYAFLCAKFLKTETNMTKKFGFKLDNGTEIQL